MIWRARLARNLNAVEASLLSAKIGRDEFPGAVHVGGPAEVLSTMICSRLRPALIAGLRVRMRFGQSQELVAALSEGDLDVVVSTLRIRSPAVAYAPLYRERFVLIGPPALAEQMTAGLSNAELLDRLGAEPIISYAGDLPILRRYWRDVFSAEIASEPALIVPDLRAVIAAVSAGLGVSVTPYYLCGDAIARGEAAILKDDEGKSFNELLLGWNRYAINHPRTAFLRDHILARFAEASEK